MIGLVSKMQITPRLHLLLEFRQPPADCIGGASPVSSWLPVPGGRPTCVSRHRLTFQLPALDMRRRPALS
jgi:hypothetical protein